MAARPLPSSDDRLDRSDPVVRDDPVISRLSDETVLALARVLARLARSYADRLEARAEAAGVPAEEMLRRDARDLEVNDRQLKQAACP